jgi:AcrR family transcriptional regulator
MAQRQGQQARRDGKRAQLIEQASATLNGFGVSHTSLSEIANRLGVSREALYYYVKDKEDLVFQCYQHSCRVLSDGLDTAQSKPAPAFEVLDAFVCGVLSEDQPEFAALSEPHCLHPEQRNQIIDSCIALKDRLAAVIQSGIEKGELRPCTPAVAALAILGLMFWIPTAQRWSSNASLSRQDIVDATREILRLGIAQDRSAPISYRQSILDVAVMPVERVFDAQTLAAARKDAILAAASWLFNLKGFGATSLDEIAERIGVTKKVIYHNIGNKETLLIACFQRTFSFYERTLHQLRDLMDQPLAFICSAVLCYSAAGMREDIAPLVSVSGLDALPAALLEEINASGVRMMDTYLEVFERAQAEGSMRAFNARAVIAAHVAVFHWLPKWRDLLSEQELEAVPLELSELIRTGLLPV